MEKAVLIGSGEVGGPNTKQDFDCGFNTNLGWGGWRFANWDRYGILQQESLWKEKGRSARMARRPLKPPKYIEQKRGRNGLLRPMPLMMLEVLHCLFVVFCGLPCGESAKIPPLSCLGVLLARVEPILTRFQFSNHVISSVG